MDDKELECCANCGEPTEKEPVVLCDDCDLPSLGLDPVQVAATDLLLALEDLMEESRYGRGKAWSASMGRAAAAVAKAKGKS